jgi:hypothetical protein
MGQLVGDPAGMPPTKAQHDLAVAARGRSFTDDPAPVRPNTRHAPDLSELAWFGVHIDSKGER